NEGRKMSENSEEVKLLEAQIMHLQAEIKALQQQQQVNCKDITFQFTGQMQDALAFLCGQTQDLEEMVVSRLKEEVEEMEEDLKLQTRIDGISLNSCIRKTVQNRGREVVQLLCLSGCCSELVFQVEFQLSEVKVSFLFFNIFGPIGSFWGCIYVGLLIHHQFGRLSDVM
ncbi:hypothetical protein ILYODFUR_029457, partial [Ilyodon furcidens]